MIDPSYEPVHFVEGFADGVLNGTADYRGVPHHFILRSAEQGKPEVYELTPLSAEVFGAVREAWEIWQRHAPALPPLASDRERQAELRVFVSHWLESQKRAGFLAEGDFEQVAADPLSDNTHASLLVKWNKLNERFQRA